jgi:hypothetical protein
MELSKRILGAEHPDTLRSMASLATTYGQQGRCKAEKLQVDVMELSKRLLGAEHPDTLTSMASLAATYGQQRRWNEAEKLQVDVMELSKRLLGAEHPDTLTSMANLAATYKKQGKWNEAEKLEVDLMELRKRWLGLTPWHPSYNIFKARKIEQSRHWIITLGKSEIVKRGCKFYEFGGHCNWEYILGKIM